MITRRSLRKIATPEPKKPVEEITTKNKRSEKRKTGPKVAPVTPKKVKLSKINFKSNDIDPIIVYLKELSHDKALTKSSHDVGAEILDQIALEGLSGIKLGRLFSLLDALIPNLNCIEDENCQQYVWSVIVSRYIQKKAIQVFYLNPIAKDESENATKGTSPTRTVIVEKEIQLPADTTKWVVESDGLLHPVQEGIIMGSCAKYKLREDISQILQDSLEREGILKSMHSINHDYGFENIYFVANQELRSKAILPNWVDPNVDVKLREYCFLELIGKSRAHGTTFPNDKALGRYRIMLVAKGFITQYQQSCSSPIEHHLLRFSSSQISNKASTTTNTKNDSDDEEENADKSLSSLCCNPYKLRSDRDTLAMVYDMIAESRGLTKLDMRKKLNIPKFHLRNHLKNLISLRVICSYRPKDSDQQFRIYKTAHKSHKRRKIKEEESIKPTKVMASWDEADLRAKKMIGHKRSSFSQAEDSLLILCRISSILIDPTLRVSWCVHKRLIRDLLHGELVESHDKTSDACLRRIKYLKRLPNNIMSINELTAELRDDPDIRKLAGREKEREREEKAGESDDKLNKLFVQVLKTVKIKIPNLLGITGATSSSATCPNATRTKTINSIGTSNLRRISSASGGGSGIGNRSVISEVEQNNFVMSKEKSIEINDHEELNQKYELVDCQSVASILRAPTYEQAKNVVDVKFNNVSLVTMAFTLTSYFSSVADSTSQTNSQAEEREEQRQQQQQQLISKKRAHQWLLEKFYSGYPDKLISFVLSKLNKRSLLTRKCPAEQALLYKPKTKMSLKLNQSVLFLLIRHHSSSLMQLTHPISQLYKIDLSESNEMASIALLTSLCSMRSFDLDLQLKVPANVVGIDQDNENFNCLIVEPCDVKFHSGEDIKLNREPLDMFLSEQEQHLTSWQVECFRFPEDLTSEKEFETKKIPIGYSARLWKQIDGSVHILTLFKLIESLLSWIIVHPGIELDLLDREFGHLMPSEHLLELLELMDNLKLITKNVLMQRDKKPRLFGFTRRSSPRQSISYEAKANAYIGYCQLLSSCRLI